MIKKYTLKNLSNLGLKDIFKIPYVKSFWVMIIMFGIIANFNQSFSGFIKGFISDTIKFIIPFVFLMGFFEAYYILKNRFKWGDSNAAKD